ncbi:MAG: response regulator, partial [Pseudomonadales bacterium]|nr:response regulator [Pseudomonadales bacterium]
MISVVTGSSRKYVIAFCLVLVIFGLIVYVYGKDSPLEPSEDDYLTVTDGGAYAVSRYMSVLEDVTGTLTIDQVRFSEHSRFKRNDRALSNYGVVKTTVWLEMIFYVPEGVNAESRVSDWYLELDQALVSVVELYVPLDNGKYEMRASDVRMQFEERELAYTNSVFPIRLLDGEKITLYLKVRNISGPLNTPVILWAPEEFIQKISRETFVYGVFFGCMLTLMLYNVFIFFSVREISYLYYVGYLTGITLYVVFQYGYGAMHIRSIYFLLGEKFITAIIWITYVFGLLFMRNFLDIERNHPRINHLINLYLCLVISSFFVGEFSSGGAKLQWVTLVSPVILPFFLIVSLYVWLQGNENGKFFTFAWIPNVLSITFSALVFSNVLSSFVQFDRVLLPISVVCEAALFSLALANRIKISRGFLLKSVRMKKDNLVKYQSIFDNASEGMYRMTLKGSVSSANQSFLKTFGLSKISDVYSDNLSVSKTLFGDNVNDRSVLISGGVVKNSFQLAKKNGRVTFIEHQARIRAGELGGFPHIEGTLLDVTEFHEKNRAILDRDREELGKKIAVLNMESQSLFLSMMNHHIRTPLTAIIGYGEFLKEGGGGLSNKEKESHVNTVVDNSHKLLILINNILDFSKVEAGKFDVERMPVSVLSVVDEIESEYSIMADQKGLSFKVNYQYPIPQEITTDPTRIIQILRNLCDNAIKFTRKGEVMLSVQWHESEQLLVFSVKDTGKGLSTRKVQSLFKGVSKENETLNAGAGLGLVLSKKLAELMSGDLVVNSQLGVGSEFSLRLIHKGSEGGNWIKSSTVRKVEAKPNANVPQLSGTILLAEDNVVNQKLIERVLKKTGVTVVVVNDGLEACDYCNEILPDIIFMDINMPNRDGVEATRYLREKGLTVPIYALTAETDKSEIEKIISAGCLGFLTKPINIK